MSCYRYCYQQDFTVLLGDDVVIDTYGWMDMVEDAYETLAQELFLAHSHARHALYGFGCISFEDKNCRNFPSFPIMSRLHYEMMGGEIFPDVFINQG